MKLNEKNINFIHITNVYEEKLCCENFFLCYLRGELCDFVEKFGDLYIEKTKVR